MRILFVVIFIIAISSCGSGPRISGVNDPLEDKVSLSSESYSTPMVLMYQYVDPFYRGSIDKATKKQTHELYLRINSGDSYQDWSKIAYLKDGTRMEKKATRVHFGPSPDGGAVCHEHIVVDLGKDDIEWFSKNEKTTIRIYSGRSTLKIDSHLTGAEATSYLNTVAEAEKALSDNK